MRQSPVCLRTNRGHTSGMLPNPMRKLPFQTHTRSIPKNQQAHLCPLDSRRTLRRTLRLQPQKLCLLHKPSCRLPFQCSSVHRGIWCRRLTWFQRGSTIPHSRHTSACLGYHLCSNAQAGRLSLKVRSRTWNPLGSKTPEPLCSLYTPKSLSLLCSCFDTCQRSSQPRMDYRAQILSWS